jgi:hypothetical protein
MAAHVVAEPYEDHRLRYVSCITMSAKSEKLPTKTRKLTAPSDEEQCSVTRTNWNMRHAQQDCIPDGRNAAANHDERKAMLEPICQESCAEC